MKYEIKKDQIASGNRLSYYDSMYVYAGGAADEIILDYWSEMHVLSGGTATATHVSNGDLRVSSGGDVSNTEVKDGEMFILSGGVAENTVLGGYGNGRIYVSSGGTANTVNMAGGAMHIAQGGAVTDLTLNGGTLYVSSGGTAENIVWTPCSGYIAAEWGAQVTYASDFTGVYYGSDNTQSMSDVQVNSVMYVMSDGVVSKGTVGSGGHLIVSSGGTANDITVSSGGILNVSSGGSASGFKIIDGTIVFAVVSDTYVAGSVKGSKFEMNNAYISAFTVYEGVDMYICSGGRAQAAVVESNGSMRVYDSGIAENTTVNAAGVMYISSGGTAMEIIENGGYVEVAEGANVTFASNTIEDLYLGSDKGMTVHSNTVVNNVRAGGSAFINVYSGGIVSGMSFAYDTSAYVYSGGIVSDVYMQGGDRYSYVTIAGESYLFVYEGGIVNNARIDVDAVFHISGGTANDIDLYGGAVMFVTDSGIASGVTVKGEMYVSNGGLVIDAVQSGGYTNVGINGAVSSIVISGGTMYVSNGGLVSETAIDSGEVYIASGASADNVEVRAGGYMYISSGGTATDVEWTPCVGTVYAEAGAIVTYASALTGVYYGSGGILLSNNELIDHAVVSSGGAMYVFSSGTATNTTVLEYSEMFIESAGTANSTTIKGGGFFRVSSGGAASDTKVEIYGSMYISSGGTAVEIIENGGYVEVAEGANVTFASNTITGLSLERDIFHRYEQNQLTVHSNTVASDITVGRSCIMYVYSGGIADGVSVAEGGSLRVSSGGTATNLKLDENNKLLLTVAPDTLISGQFNQSHFEMSDGKIEDYQINRNSMHILSGGTATSTTLGDFGLLDVYYGGIADSTLVNGYEASMYIYSGGVANETTVDGRNATMYIYSGGTANNIIVNDGTVTLYSGGTAGDVDVKIGAAFNIESGAVGNDVLVNGGYMNISSGGIAFNTTVNDGVINISGGKHTGYLHIGEGIVRVSDGGIIDFNIADEAVNDEYFINNFEGINGEALYTVTVSAEGQISGTFKLAQGAENFDSVISVGDGTTIYGSITVGQEYTYNDGTYLLNLEDGNLTLTVTVDDKTPPRIPTVTLSTYEPTNENVTVTAEFSRDSVKKEYSYDNKTWQDYTAPIVMTDNGIVYFRGTDLAGNVSNAAECVVNNIDREAPTLVINGNVDNFTNQNVVLTAEVSDGIVEYFDGESWIVGYTLEVSENGTYSFRVTDAAGNVTEDSVEVIYIDKDAPAAPEVSANRTDWDYGDVTVKATFSNDSVVKEYSLDNENWHTYCEEEGVVFVYNGTVWFRGQDAAGNYSDTIVYEVTCIRNTIPLAPEAFADITSITNQNVIVSAEFDDDITEKQYSFDRENWYEYTEGIKFEENGVIYFRCKNEKGNYSPIVQYVVDNIDKVPPSLKIIADETGWTNQNVVLTAEVSDGTVEYFDGEKWVEGSSLTVETNGTYQFRATDIAGNVTEKYFTVSNIDKVPPTLDIESNKPEWTNQNVVLTAEVSDGTVEYFDGEKWVEGSSLTVETNGTYQFRATDIAGNVTEKYFTVSNIDKTAPDAPHLFSENITANDVILNWNTVFDVNDDASDRVKGYYIRYGNSDTLAGDGEYITAARFSMTVADIGTYYYQIKAVDIAGNISDWSDVRSFEVKKLAIRDLLGSINGLSWTAAAGAKEYTVEYSTDNFANVFSFETSNTAVDTFAMPENVYQWRVDAVGTPAGSRGEDITAQPKSEDPQKFISDTDGDIDIFFANVNGVWSDRYLAQHEKISDVASVELAGKNNIVDTFEGSDDANILVLTDDANGDVLFVDDIYSATAEEGARIAMINEIRAGAGDDVVDFTSNRYEYVGKGVSIFGGAGNDVIWSADGENRLFGDAGDDNIVGGSGDDIIVGGIGNDTLHGGGGNDIFCFSGDFGIDTVTQLDGGSVTLYFDSEDVQWDEETNSCTDGRNSVTLNGDFEFTVFCKTPDELVSVGAFEDFTSEKIFEEKTLVA